ncbi:MAG: isoprenylcysteine carboxylmethyltransferase family protein [Candidatus Dormibacteraeota bacterium]|nr:isoprenylcysteine carboxylmethyltransferase family protein [Candidatus Dormibacteraeota bacterium]MBV9524734.1 isoprenylcysteine carboxylmethyltransferase family protein [Candidatus Dormibacteraeota bacterium]
MRVFEVFFGVGWLLFWVFWLSAAVNSKSSVGRAPQHIALRLGIVVVVIVLLRTNAFNMRTSLIDDAALQAAGLALFVGGLSVAVWARLNLGRNWGMPMSEKADPELVTSGPYRYIRHPIYSGIILAMVGTALGIGLLWLIVALLIGAYFVFSATVEERTLARLFPSTYPAYKRATHMLVPFLL